MLEIRDVVRAAIVGSISVVAATSAAAQPAPRPLPSLSAEAIRQAEAAVRQAEEQLRQHEAEVRAGLDALDGLPGFVHHDFDFDFDFDFEFDSQAASPQPSPMPAQVSVAAKPPVSSSAADNAYRQARELIDRGRYERALEQLDRMIGRYPNTIANRVDAALYWKAYAEAKLAQRTEALATLADMQKRFADSRWLRDARALELEIRQASGQAISPEAQADEELKLLALRGLMQSDPDRALPMVEQILSGNSSVRVKERALFVLSQSRAPRARDIVVGVAKSADNPDVQLRAIRYLGAMRSSDNRQILNEIYRSSNDQAVKRAIIQSLISSEAVDQLTEIAKTEKDVQLRRSAIRRLGSMDRARTGELLRALYASDASPEGRREIINALSSQENAPVLVALARAEKDPALKRDIVARLSTMKSKEATDYLLELLK